jgi:hypothetical protein
MAEQLDRSFGILARGLREMTAKVEAENAAWQEYITQRRRKGRSFMYRSVTMDAERQRIAEEELERFRESFEPSPGAMT